MYFKARVCDLVNGTIFLPCLVVELLELIKDFTCIGTKTLSCYTTSRASPLLSLTDGEEEEAGKGHVKSGPHH